jgi:hypothetical protein
MTREAMKLCLGSFGDWKKRSNKCRESEVRKLVVV